MIFRLCIFFTPPALPGRFEIIETLNFIYNPISEVLQWFDRVVLKSFPALSSQFYVSKYLWELQLFLHSIGGAKYLEKVFQKNFFFDFRLAVFLLYFVTADKVTFERKM